ncbi:MAG: hypothetical protein KDA84_12520 [Planctomycetaceae bacterium]|nr:hypothetical protein [Planctomycetaceae bacterium]
MAGLTDSTLIDQIVFEVLAQLRQRVGSSNTSHSNGQPTHKPEPPQLAEIQLVDAVITAETLKKAAIGGGIVNVPPKAIVTPSARDYLREHKIQLVQGGINPTQEKRSSDTRGIIVASHFPGVVKTFLDEVKRQYSSSWNVEIESGNAQVIERTRSIVCRGESPQVLVFVKEPHRVACFVNRNSQCRAAVVQRGADVETVRAEIGANVICISPEQPTYMELRKIFRAATETHRQIQEPSEG